MGRPGVFSATRTRTRENPYPRLRVRVFPGMGAGLRRVDGIGRNPQVKALRCSDR